MTGQARKIHTQQTHFLRKRINFNTAGIAGGVVIGTVPKNSVIADVRARVNTIFNAATTNVIIVGLTQGGSELVAGGTIVPGVVGGYAGVTLLATGAQVANDTDVWVSYTQTGAAATTGQADIVVEFIPDMDG